MSSRWNRLLGGARRPSSGTYRDWMAIKVHLMTNKQRAVDQQRPEKNSAEKEYLEPLGATFGDRQQ
jgi:hypothetical protein